MEGPTGTENILISSGIGAFFGAAVGSIESVWSIPKLGAKLPKFSSQIKHIGVRSLVFASAAGFYATGEYIAASARQKDDAVNAAVGGLITGVVPGIVTRSVKAGVITGVAAAALMSSTHFWQSTQVSGAEKYARAKAAQQA